MSHLFSIEFVLLLLNDCVNGGFIDEHDETETTWLSGLLVNFNNRIFHLSELFKIRFQRLLRRRPR